MHFAMPEGDGYRQLVEDQHVEMTLGTGRQGLLRRADRVRGL